MKIVFFASSRADYELIHPLLRQIDKKKIKTVLVASGDLYSKKHGNYFKRIINDKISINYSIKYEASKICNINAFSLIVRKAKNILQKEKPDYVYLVGDKYETLSFGIASVLLNFPIIHYGGGQVSSGAWDDRCRHSLSKMSIFHFVSTKLSKKRLMQLGESQNNILVTGSINVEVQKNIKLYSEKYVKNFLKFEKNQKYILVTLHSTSLEKDLINFQLNQLITCLKKIKNVKVIFTFPNSDIGSNLIIKTIIKNCNKNKNFQFYKSLGKKLFLSMLKYSSVLVGNSSSGIIEAPTYKIPSIDIGNRQKGRERSKSVLSCTFNSNKIYNLLLIAIKNKNFFFNNPYEKKNTIQLILRKLYSLKKKKSLIKNFIDWNNNKC